MLKRGYRRTWPWLCLLLVVGLLLSVSGSTPTYAQNDRSLVYYPQTGHFLGGEFRVFFEQRGGVPFFGYPVTPEFISKQSGRIIQYFERFRFELRVGPDQTPIIEIGHLGREFVEQRGYQFAPIAPLPDTPTRRYFPETGHSISGAFKQYWDSNNGGFSFGLPISEEIGEILSDGRQYTVQYFEKARMELHPDGVKVGLLGREVAPCQQLAPRPHDMPPSGPAPEGDDDYCDDLSKLVMGTVFPTVGAPGTLFGLRAIRYEPGEEVELWLNKPDASVRRLNYRAEANEGGTILVGFETSEDDMQGNWSIVARGTESERQVVVPFQVLR